MKHIFNRKGFTLIELVVVLGIVAILVALAVPSYTQYVLKANRGEAQQLLLNWSNNQEIWRANDTDYATTGELALPTHAKFTFALPTRTATTYVLRATANGNQANDKEQGTTCSPMEINQANAKTPADCW